MTAERTQRERPGALKWVSLAFLIGAVPVIPLFALGWVFSSLGAAVGHNDDFGPAYGPAGGSLLVMFFAFVIGVFVWIVGCVTQRTRGIRESRTCFRVATVVLATGMVITAVLWIPLGWQAIH